MAGEAVRRWARWFLLVGTLALFGSLVVAVTGNAASTPAVAPVTTPNPRCGVAGVWKQSVLQSLYLSQVATGTPEPGGYTWERLTPCNAVQMVRTCNFGEAPRADCYDVDDGGIPNGYVVTFTNWVANNPGQTWLLGNEPDRLDQDNITPAEYAQMYHYFYHVIKTADPSATIATAGISQDPSAGYPITSGWAWAGEALNAYEAAYSTPMPIDIWNFHVYNEDDYYSATVESDFDGWIDFIETTREGMYAATPIWLTEWGKLDGWLEPSYRDNHLPDDVLHPELVHLMWDWARWMAEQGKIDRWFWYVGGMGDWDRVLEFKETAWLLEPEIDYVTGTGDAGGTKSTLVDADIPTPEHNATWVGATLFLIGPGQGRRVTSYHVSSSTLTVSPPFDNVISGTYRLFQFGYATPTANFLGGAYAYFCNPGVFTNTLHLPVTLRDGGGQRDGGGSDPFHSPLATPGALDSPLATPTPRPTANPTATGAVLIDDFNTTESPSEHGWSVLEPGGVLIAYSYKFDSPKLHPVDAEGRHRNFRFTYPAVGEGLELARSYLSFEVGDVDGWWAAVDVQGDDGREYQLRYEPRFGTPEVVTEDGRTTVVYPIGEGYVEAGYFQDVGRNLSADLRAGAPGVGVALVERLIFYGTNTLDDVVLQEPAFRDDRMSPVTHIRLEGTLGNQGWYTSPVRLAILSADEAGGSGVNLTYRRYDQGRWRITRDYARLTEVEGRRLLETYAIDWAGNVEKVVTTELQIDRTPPVVRIEAPVAGEYSPESTLAVAYVAEDAASGVELVVVRLDGVELVNQRQLKAWTLEPGRHTLEVTATDAAGWQTIARRTFTVSGW